MSQSRAVAHGFFYWPKSGIAAVRENGSALLMRIAIVADIHGNLQALHAALARIETMRPDTIVVLGDVVVGSPDSLACWELVKSLKCPVLRGNHERYVFDLGTERAPAEWNTPQFGPVQFAAKQLAAVRQELAALPTFFRLTEAPDVLFVHGSLRSDTDLVFPYTSDAEIEPMFAGASERWLMRGHNHYAGVRLWGERRIVTVGSVGLPLDGTPAAQFSLLEWFGKDWSVQQYAVPYDVDAAVRRFSESGYLDEAGPMARLFMREVETASLHIVPFLKWRKTFANVELAEAVQQFLRR
ncbi:MAG: metallophosphoesterase family protein [Nibricoccus sp.]